MRSIASHGVVGLAVLGSAFLAVTGAEALYADMGHFGRGPIQAAWITVVFPALALNYLGQAALILKSPDAIANPFFLMAPSWGLLPLVLLATIATVIASQAVITGAFSVTQQAIQLGLLPRMEIHYTSDIQAGQIFLPDTNRLLLIGVLILVFSFRTSGALAFAYGIAVTGTMVVTACLAFIVVWKAWHWPLVAALLFIAPFLLVGADRDLAARCVTDPRASVLSFLALVLRWATRTRRGARRARRRGAPPGCSTGRRAGRGCREPEVVGAVEYRAERVQCRDALAHERRPFLGALFLGEDPTAQNLTVGLRVLEHPPVMTAPMSKALMVQGTCSKERASP